MGTAVQKGVRSVIMNALLQTLDRIGLLHGIWNFLLYRPPTYGAEIDMWRRLRISQSYNCSLVAIVIAAYASYDEYGSYPRHCITWVLLGLSLIGQVVVDAAVLVANWIMYH